MMKSLILTAALATTSLSCAAMAQDSEHDAIMAELMEAYGGEERLEGLQQVELDMVGYFHARFQSRHTEHPWDQIPTRGFFYYDFVTQQGANDRISAWAGDLNMGGRDIYRTDGVYSLNTIEKTYIQDGMAAMHGASGLISGMGARQAWAFVLWLNNRDDLEYGEDIEFRGKTYKTYTFDNGSAQLYIDKETGLIYGYDRTASISHMGAPNDPIRVFDQYFEKDGIWVNRRSRHYQYDLPLYDLLLGDIKFNHGSKDQHLEIPANYVPQTEGTGGYGTGWDPVAIEISEGVWLAGNPETHVLYVDTGDYWVATEAGDMPSNARLFYETMQPHMNGEPLRYIVPTHHHDDHAISVKYYASIGATILTTRDKEGELRRLLAADVDGIGPQTDAQFEFIEEEIHTIDTGGTPYQAFVYANAPHTENMIVAYAPTANAVFQADIFIDYGTPTPRQGAGFGIRHFDRWIKAHQAAGNMGPIDHYLAVHGGGFGKAEFEAMLSRPRTVTVLPGNQEWNTDDWHERYGLHNDTVGNAKRDKVIQDPAYR